MTFEGTTKVVLDTTNSITKITEMSLKKAWSILDAASKKKIPSECLSQNAIRALQGNTKGIGG
jgi:hypothetical protein